MLFPLPIAIDLAREAVRTESFDPRHAPTAARTAALQPTRAPAVRRARQLLAGGLHRVAEAVAPGEGPRHYGTAH